MILGLSMSSSGFSVDPAAVLPEGMGSSEVRAMTFFVDVLNFLGALFDKKSPRPHPVQSNALGIPEQQSTFLLGSWTSLRTNGRNWTTGKTFFPVFGPYDTDYEVEASEVREALKDFEFVGQEKTGDYMVSLFPAPSIRGVFVEDNQATIRILENGKSPTFRHTDKTQRINLSWLSEQKKRGWYDLTYGPSKMQVADVLTKPFFRMPRNGNLLWPSCLMWHPRVGQVNPMNPNLRLPVSHGQRLWRPAEAPGNQEPVRSQIADRDLLQPNVQVERHFKRC
jgi:hypothetical protein